MRRITVVGMIILGLVAVPLVVGATPAPDKVEMCHMTGDGGAHVIKVSTKAMQKHLDHGDTKVDEANPAVSCGTDSAPPDPGEIPAPTITATFVVESVTCNFVARCNLTLDASGSEGAITTYAWVASNGLESASATGVNPTIGPFLQNTLVTIELTVDDGNGTVDSVVQAVVAIPTP